MLEIATEVLAELDAGRAVTVVTISGVDGSAPRALGSSMAVTEAGAVIGSLSGGCVEGDAVELALRVGETGVAESAVFGFDDESAFRAGLSCGGRLTVLARRIAPGDGAIVAALRDAAAGRPTAIAVVAEIPGDARPHPLLGRVVPVPAPAPARSARVIAEADGVPAVVLCLVAAPPPRMVIIGAVDYSASLAAAAAAVGYRVAVVDPRPLFATPQRFPEAHEVVVAWPDDYLTTAEVDERSVIAVLTHSDRFDIPALRVALRLPVAYVGAMGSRATHRRRLLALHEEGLAEAELARLHSPIGLDIGASSPEETAVSIMAEVLAARSGRTGAALSTTSGAIHDRVDPMLPARSPLDRAVDALIAAPSSAAGSSRC